MMKRKMAVGIILLGLATCGTIGNAYAAEGVESGKICIDSNFIQPHTVVNVGGGRWRYGFEGEWVYSKYNHNSKRHKSSVKTSNGSKTSGWMPATVESDARMYSTLSGNECYWDTRKD